MNESPHAQSHGKPVDEGRRRLCQVAIGGMTAVAAGTVGYPVLAFLNLPKSLQPKEAMKVTLADLVDGGAVWGDHNGRQIVVLKVGENVRAFDGACPHLGCIVRWDGPSRTFKCPCHGAAFNAEGEPIGGPVNAPLESVQFAEKDGVLEIA